MSATEDIASLFEPISVEDADAALASGSDKGQFDGILEAFVDSNLYAVAVPLDRGPLQGREPSKARQSLSAARDRTRKNKENGSVEQVHPDWVNTIKIRVKKNVTDKVFLINPSLKPS